MKDRTGMERLELELFLSSSTNMGRNLDLGLERFVSSASGETCFAVPVPTYVTELFFVKQIQVGTGTVKQFRLSCKLKLELTNRFKTVPP